MSQNDPKTTSLMMSSQKIRTPQPKNFFRVQSARLADPFEPLNSSSASGEGARALVRQPKTAVFRPKSKYEYTYASSQSVNPM